MPDSPDTKPHVWLSKALSLAIQRPALVTSMSSAPIPRDRSCYPERFLLCEVRYRAPGVGEIPSSPCAVSIASVRGPACHPRSGAADVQHEDLLAVLSTD